MPARSKNVPPATLSYAILFWQIVNRWVDVRPVIREEMPAEAADFPEAEFPAPIQPTFQNTRRNRSTFIAAKT
jgi:hypothetical protein